MKKYQREIILFVIAFVISLGAIFLKNFRIETIWFEILTWIGLICYVLSFIGFIYKLKKSNF